MSIGYNNVLTSNTSKTKFVGLVITNSLSWKDHITHLTPKLCKACYVLRCIRPFMSQDTMKSLYYSSFHSLTRYRAIFWGNSWNSLHVSWLQKRAVRIILGQDEGIPVEDLKKLRILPLQSQYMLSLSLFVVNNKNLFHVNSEIHGFNTRQNCNHQLQANLSLYQRGLLCWHLNF